MSPKSTEEWEMEDIINELKAGIPQPGTTIPGVCAFHGSTNKALIYLLRRTIEGGHLTVTADWKTAGIEAIKTTPWLAFVALIGYAMHIYHVMKGVVP
jgi:hypothetical protein